jgi:16S rRNA U516 pseudouridylate synthase RsuA-like enzyme
MNGMFTRKTPSTSKMIIPINEKLVRANQVKLIHFAAQLWQGKRRKVRRACASLGVGLPVKNMRAAIKLNNPPNKIAMIHKMTCLLAVL